MAEAAIADHVDDHILAEFLAELGGDAGGMDHGLGSSPLTWKIGASTIRAMSVG